MLKLTMPIVSVVAIGIIASSIAAPAAASNADRKPVGLAPIMGEYDAASFAEVAQTLPMQLTQALERDLGVEPEEYLARAAAAVDASTLLGELTDLGIEPNGAQLTGTELTVFVNSDAEAGTVEALGAIAAIGESPERDFSGVDFRQLADLRGGQPYYYEDAEFGYYCTLGFTGYDKANGANNYNTTAGHCLAPGYPQTWELQVSSPFFTDPVSTLGAVLGNFTSTRLGSGYDVGLVRSSSSWAERPEVLTWSGGTGAPTGSPLAVTDSVVGVVGAPVCKSGATSGWTCGEILAVDETVTVDGQTLNAVISDICMLGGDSGGPGLVGSAALGINAAGTWENSCNLQDQSGEAVSAFFPMSSSVSAAASVTKAYGSAWELGVRVEAPTVTIPASGGTVKSGSPMSGTVPGGNVRHTVRVYIDGSTSPRTAKVASDGTWSVSLAGLSGGAHTYKAVARWGTYSNSTSTSGTFTVDAPVVKRISGSDRYAVGVNISKLMYPDGGAPVVYIAKGSDYPDALSAGPAAASEGAPLLLTPSTSLHPAVKAEIQRLTPAKIVVVGGVGSITPAVFSQLSALAPDVVRLGGADRYVASRAVVDYAFESATVAYIATGATFPDALAASATGGAIGAPVILVPGKAASIDSATRSLLESLGVTQIKIAGGPGSVSPGIEAALRSITPSVTRLGGADRFVASWAINADAYSANKAAFLSTGFNFPDALSGAALAGQWAAPLYSVKTNCVPAYVLSDLARLGVDKVYLLGGTGTLTKAVENLVSC